MLWLDGGENIYIGQTNGLRNRISQHENNKILSTAGRSPLLCYREVFPTRKAATKREVELKELHLIDPSQIRQMIADELSRFTSANSGKVIRRLK